jgi:hypothetical protein
MPNTFSLTNTSQPLPQTGHLSKLPRILVFTRTVERRPNKPYTRGFALQLQGTRGAEGIRCLLAWLPSPSPLSVIRLCQIGSPPFATFRGSIFGFYQYMKKTRLHCSACARTRTIQNNASQALNVASRPVVLGKGGSRLWPVRRARPSPCELGMRQLSTHACLCTVLSAKTSEPGNLVDVDALQSSVSYLRIDPAARLTSPSLAR